MADHYSTLRRSLTDRAHALGSYVNSLKAGITRTDDAFSLALEMCRAYTVAVTDQVNSDWNQDKGDSQRQRLILTQHLKQFLERERWIDQRFTRGSQDDVPRALRSIARREFRRHGLVDHEPVLTVGAPDSFETHKSDLFSFLFDDLFVASRDRSLDHLRFAPKLSVISVPYIEGTRALWHPIIVGHEIAHIRLDHARSLMDRRDLTSDWLSDPNSDWFDIQRERMEESPERASPRLDVKSVLETWVDELLCDLNAVRLFGPAGLSAVAEFLVLLDTGGRGADQATKTHPPLSTRLAVLFQYVERLGYDPLPNYAHVWRSYVDSSRRTAIDREARFLISLVSDRQKVDRLIDYVETWGESCDATARRPSVDWVERQLLDGVPGGTHRPGTPWAEVAASDVVNAAWGARATLDAPPASRDWWARGALIDSEQLNNRDKRLRIDSLASKAIDSIELSILWGPNQGMIGLDHPRVQDVAAAPGDTPTVAGGVMSRVSITQRLLAARAAEGRPALVVTPLFEDSIQDAGVDLRLGPDFIVFRHSSTAAFDPLDYSQDPRAMQERVHKGWGERFILHPGELVLASTLEYVVLPDDVAGQVVTRSSYGRLGLLTATAVQIQPGSRGCITLELVNHSQTPIALTPGVRLAQLILFPLVNPTPVPNGRYWFPVGPEFSKVHDDADAPALERIGRQASPGRRFGTIGFSYTAPAVEASAFEDVVERERRGVKLKSTPATEIPPTRDELRVGGAEIALIMLSGTATISTLASIAANWRRERQRSVVLQETPSGDIDVQILPEHAPTGLTIVKSADGIEVGTVDHRGTAADIADLLARFFGRDDA